MSLHDQHIELVNKFHIAHGGHPLKNIDGLPPDLELFPDGATMAPSWDRVSGPVFTQPPIHPRENLRSRITYRRERVKRGEAVFDRAKEELLRREEFIGGEPTPDEIQALKKQAKECKSLRKELDKLEGEFVERFVPPGPTEEELALLEKEQMRVEERRHKRRLELYKINV